MSNIIDIKQYRKPIAGFALDVFELAVEKDLSADDIVAQCLMLINTLTIVRPDLVGSVKIVANEIIGEEND